MVPAPLPLLTCATAAYAGKRRMGRTENCIARDRSAAVTANAPLKSQVVQTTSLFLFGRHANMSHTPTGHSATGGVALHAARIGSRAPAISVARSGSKPALAPLGVYLDKVIPPLKLGDRRAG